MAHHGQSENGSRNTRLLHRWEWAVASYTILLVVLSIVLFMMHKVSGQIGDLIVEQNAAALKLWESLDYYDHRVATINGDTPSPPGLMDDVVHFSRANAILIKTVQRSTVPQLLRFNSNWQDLIKSAQAEHIQSFTTDFNHLVFDPAIAFPNLIKEGMYQIKLYQLIRDIAQDGYNFHRVCFGAIAQYILPILYAALGAFLYTFRSISRTDQNKPSPTVDSLLNRNIRFLTARFLTAVIAGVAIGVFKFPKDAFLSPLAVAFVVGYSIDVFTSLLDGYVEKFTKRTEQGPVATGSSIEVNPA